MKEFRDLRSFNRFLGTLEALTVIAEREGLERGAKMIEDEAKREIGRYQRENMGPFAPWEELADATKADRVQKGFPANNPLLRSGELYHSIEHTVEMSFPGHGEAAVGSNSDIAVYQELGTDRIPARSFLGSAAYRRADAVATQIGARVVWAIRGLAKRND